MSAIQALFYVIGLIVLLALLLYYQARQTPSSSEPHDGPAAKDHTEAGQKLPGQHGRV